MLGYLRFAAEAVKIIAPAIETLVTTAATLQQLDMVLNQNRTASFNYTPSNHKEAPMAMHGERSITAMRLMREGKWDERPHRLDID